MKIPIKVLFVFVLLTSFGCKDNEMSISSIQGEWELKSSFNGWTGDVVYPKGNRRIFKFTATTYENFEQGKLIKSGTYKIVDGTSALTKLPGKQIIYDNQTNTINTFIEIKDNILSFSSDAYDAGYSSYTKIGGN